MFRDIFLEFPLLTKLDSTLVGTLLENTETYEVLTIPTLSNKDRYAPSKSEYDVVSLFGE
jgi:hypothetical protein